MKQSKEIEREEADLPAEQVTPEMSKRARDAVDKVIEHRRGALLALAAEGEQAVERRTCEELVWRRRSGVESWGSITGAALRSWRGRVTAGLPKNIEFICCPLLTRCLTSTEAGSARLTHPTNRRHQSE